MRKSTLAMLMMAVGFASLSPRGVEAALTKPRSPLVLDDSFAVPEDTEATVVFPGVLGNDRALGGRALNAVLVTRPAHGQLNLRPDGALSYTPAPDFNGFDVFSYVATDGERQSEPAMVAITVMPVNDAPVAVNDVVFFTGLATLKLTVLANDVDVDGNLVPETVTIVSPPRNGKVTIGANGVIDYRPMSGFAGGDAFTYVVWDNLGVRSNPATVRLQRR